MARKVTRCEKMRAQTQIRTAAARLARAAAAVLALAVLTGCVPRELSPEARAVLTRWLAQDCDTGERGRLRLQLCKFGTVLEEPLMRAFENGPPPEQTDRAVNAAREQFAYTRRAIEAQQFSGLDLKQIEAIRSVPIAEHLKRVRENTVDGYRSAALAGLAAIGSRKGRQLLEKLARDPQSPYQDMARSALGQEVDLKSER